MESKRRERRAWPAAALLTLSLLLHAALLLLPLPAPRHETSRPDAATLVVDLVSPPADSPAESSASPPEPAQPLPEENQPAPKPSTAESALAVHRSASVPSPAQAPVAATSSSADATADPIQAQLLSAARARGQESERAEQAKGLHYDAAPALPSRPGWLHQYTGPVTPSINRWTGSDGSRNARIVTGSGQIFCVRTRAPTIAETFNPWMSSAIPMVHGCGRQRPEAPEATDPWVRRPGE